MATKNIRFHDGDNNTLLPLSFNVYNVTWAQLKSFRDTGTLHKGMRYRITDYQCTTTQENTQSAGHQFDIIVTALSENKLGEEAQAMLHDGDTYFANCNLQAWQLLYCLDNDTSRFAWADAENGKGVIYRMIDEYGNDLPYDFKNIQFKRSYCTIDGENYLAIPGLKMFYDGENKEQVLTGQDDAKAIFCYTFSCLVYNDSNDDEHAADLSQLDTSVGSYTTDIYESDEMTRPYGNIFEPYLVLKDNGDGTKSALRSLPNIVFQQRKGYASYYYVYDNHIGSECHDLSFNGIAAYGNNFSGEIHACVFAGEAYGNTVCGELQNCVFADDMRFVFISGNVLNNYFKATVYYSIISGEITKTTVGGWISESNISGRVDGCTFKGGIYSSVFSSETLLCTFAGHVDSCSFEGLCNGFSFPGSTDNKLQYVRQVGFIYIQTAKNKDSLPTLTTGAKYQQLLTEDADGNVVVKTIY